MVLSNLMQYVFLKTKKEKG